MGERHSSPSEVVSGPLKHLESKFIDAPTSYKAPLSLQKASSHPPQPVTQPPTVYSHPTVSTPYQQDTILYNGEVQTLESVRAKIWNRYTEDTNIQRENTSHNANTASPCISEMTLRYDTVLEMVRLQVFAERNAQWDYLKPEDMETIKPKEENRWLPDSIIARNYYCNRSHYGRIGKITRERVDLESVDPTEKHVGNQIWGYSFNRERQWPPKEFVQQPVMKAARGRGGKRKYTSKKYQNHISLHSRNQTMNSTYNLLGYSKLPAKCCWRCHTQKSALWLQWEEKPDSDNKNIKKEVVPALELDQKNGNGIKDEIQLETKFIPDKGKIEPSTPLSLPLAVPLGLASLGLPPPASITSAVQLSQANKNAPQTIKHDVCLLCYLHLTKPEILQQKKDAILKKIADEERQEAKRLRHEAKELKKKMNKLKRKDSLSKKLVVQLNGQVKHGLSTDTTHTNPIRAHSPQANSFNNFNQDTHQKRNGSSSSNGIRSMPHKIKRQRLLSEEASEDTNMHDQQIDEHRFLDDEKKSNASVSKYSLGEMIDKNIQNFVYSDNITRKSKKQALEKIEGIDSDTFKVRLKHKGFGDYEDIIPSPSPEISDQDFEERKLKKRKSKSHAKSKSKTKSKSASKSKSISSEQSNNRLKLRRSSNSNIQLNEKSMRLPTTPSSSTRSTNGESHTKRTSRRHREETEREKELRELGQYCPVCNITYEEDDECSFVCCDTCEMWVHASCDSTLTPEKVAHLSESNEKYMCPLCEGR